MNKKFIYIVVLILISIITVSCSRNIHFDAEELKENIVKVELLNYTSTTEYDIIVTIEEKNELENFLNEFSKLSLTITYGAPGNLEGYCINLIYNNDNYTLITKSHMENRNKNNEILKENRIHCDNEKYNSLIYKMQGIIND